MTEAGRSNRHRRRLWFVLRLLVAGGLLGGMLYWADFSEATSTFDARTAWASLVACVILAITLHLSAIRWGVVLGGGLPGTRALSRLYFIGWFFSQFLPSSVGGDAARLVGLNRSGVPLGRAGSSIIIERLLGLAALVVFLIIGAAFFPALALRTAEGSSLGIPMAWLLIGGGVAVLVGVTALAMLLRHERVRSLMRTTLVLWKEFLESRRRIWIALSLSVLVQGGYILTWAVLAFGLGLEVPLLVHLFFVPAVSLAALLPITVSGLGVREGFTFLVLAPFAVSAADAVAYGLLFYGCSILVGGFGGLVFLRSGLTVQRVAEASGETGETEEANRPVHAMNPDSIESCTNPHRSGLMTPQ